VIGARRRTIKRDRSHQAIGGLAIGPGGCRPRSRLDPAVVVSLALLATAVSPAAINPAAINPAAINPAAVNPATFGPAVVRPSAPQASAAAAWVGWPGRPVGAA